MENVQVETLSGNTFDTYPSLLLRIQKKQYIFNLPEMFQRNLLAKHIKLKNIQAAFITSAFPDSVGGLSVFILQTYYQKNKIFPIIGPKEIPDVILFDHDYVGNNTASKYQNQVLNNFSNNDIEVKSINLTKSISYDIFIKKQNQHLLFVDCRSIEDLTLLPDLNEFSEIFHLTIPEILIQKEYFTFFTSHISNKTVHNFCFMPSGIITNEHSYEYYTRRSKNSLQPLSQGDTLKAPDGFTNITSSKAEYNLIKKQLEITNQGEIIDINYDELKNLNSLQIKSRLIKSEPSLPEFDKYAVTFLGSSTKFVGVNQNDSGYLIHTKSGFVVFDPSEGFLCQIQRKFGPRITEYILKNIECIWISHFHHDHCFGSPSLLYERSKLTEKKALFLAPQKFIESIQKVSQIYSDFKVVYNNREDESSTADDVVLIPINDHLSIQSINVFHDTPFAKGCLLSIDGIAKIAFSGDRSYQKDHFALAFKNCDLLIHEATFPDREKSANYKINKKHCEFFEAMETANLMKPKFTVFTHLSQRYTDEEITKKIDDIKIFAFDFLEFSDINAADIFHII